MWSTTQCVIWVSCLILLASGVQQVSSREQVDNGTQTMSCELGDIKFFNYRSLTKFFNSDNHQILIIAKIRMVCMGIIRSDDIRYWSQIVHYEFYNLDSNGTVLRGLKSGERNKKAALMEANFLMSIKDRLKKVGDWFSEAWDSAKNWVGNKLTSNGVSVLKPEELAENGINLPAECDDSSSEPDEDEEGEEAKYTEEGQDSKDEEKSDEKETANGTEGEEEEGGEHENSEQIMGGSRGDWFRETGLGNSLSNVTADDEKYEQEISRLIKIPFIMYQNFIGQVIEVAFMEDDNEQSINLKRHICDLFSTNLNRVKVSQEVTTLGKQEVTYSRFTPAQSKQQMAEQGFNSEEFIHKPTNKHKSKGKSRGSGIGETRPTGGREIGVMRTISAVEKVDKVTKLMAPELDKMEIKVMQQQKVSAGSPTSISGHMSMKMLQSNEVGKRVRVKRKAKQEQQEELEVGNMFKVSTTFAVNRLTYLEELKLVKASEKTRRRTRAARTVVEEAESSLKLDSSEMKLLEKMIKKFKTSSLIIPQSNSFKEIKRDRLKELRNKVKRRLKRETRKGSSPKSNKKNNKLKPTSAKLEEFGSSVGRALIEYHSAARDGSFSSDVEEVLELEAELGEDTRNKASITRILRDMARPQQVRKLCLQSLPTLDKFRKAKRLSRSDRAQLERCKKVLRVLILAGHSIAQDILIEMIDECSIRALACQEAGKKSKHCKAAQRYYDAIRQQLSEMLVSVNKPTSILLNKLLIRYTKPLDSLKKHESYKKLVESSMQRDKAGETEERPQWKVDEMNARKLGRRPNSSSLIGTLTQLAAKPSVDPSKRNEIIKTLVEQLSNMKGCTRPQDVDILEALGEFQDPQEAISKRVLQQAKQCLQHENHLVACVHALRGQLTDRNVERFLKNLLLSRNVSCLVKSEVVYTLLEALQLEQLKWIENESQIKWPASGQQNDIDSTLMNVLRGGSGADRKCLGALIMRYMAMKQVKVQLRPETATLGQSRADIPDEEMDRKFHCTRMEAGTGNNCSQLAPEIRRRLKCEVRKRWGIEQANIILGMALTADQLESEESRFEANIPITGNFLGVKLELGRMQVSRQANITRTKIRLLGRKRFSSPLDCNDEKPHWQRFMPFFRRRIYFVRVNVGVRVHAEMDLDSNCGEDSPSADGDIDLTPNVGVKAGIESSADALVGRTGIQVALNYGVQGKIHVSKPPETCMTVTTSSQSMNISLGHWMRFFRYDCIYFGSNFIGTTPNAIRWTLPNWIKPSVWLKDKCFNPTV